VRGRWRSHAGDGLADRQLAAPRAVRLALAGAGSLEHVPRQALVRHLGREDAAVGDGEQATSDVVDSLALDALAVGLVLGPRAVRLAFPLAGLSGRVPRGARVGGSRRKAGVVGSFDGGAHRGAQGVAGLAQALGRYLVPRAVGHARERVGARQLEAGLARDLSGGGERALVGVVNVAEGNGLDALTAHALARGRAAGPRAVGVHFALERVAGGEAGLARVGGRRGEAVPRQDDVAVLGQQGQPGGPAHARGVIQRPDALRVARAHRVSAELVTSLAREGGLGRVAPVVGDRGRAELDVADGGALDAEALGLLARPLPVGLALADGRVLGDEARVARVSGGGGEAVAVVGLHLAVLGLVQRRAGGALAAGGFAAPLAVGVADAVNRPSGLEAFVARVAGARGVAVAVVGAHASVLDRGKSVALHGLAGRWLSGPAAVGVAVELSGILGDEAGVARVSRTRGEEALVGNRDAAVLGLAHGAALDARAHGLLAGPPAVGLAVAAQGVLGLETRVALVDSGRGKQAVLAVGGGHEDTVGDLGRKVRASDADATRGGAAPAAIGCASAVGLGRNDVTDVALVRSPGGEQELVGSDDEAVVGTLQSLAANGLLASGTHETRGALALELVDLVNARAAVLARVGVAVIDVDLAVEASEAGRALAAVAVHSVDALALVQAGGFGAVVDVVLALRAREAARAAALKVVGLVDAGGIVLARARQAVINVVVTDLAAVTGRALALERVGAIDANSAVLAGARGTVVNVNRASGSKEANGALASEAVDAIDAGAAVHAGGVLAVVDVNFASLALESLPACALIVVFPVSASTTVLARVAQTVVDVDLAVAALEARLAAALVVVELVNADGVVLARI